MTKFPQQNDKTIKQTGKTERLKDMKIATFNVNGLRSRIPIVLNWLLKNRPDVLCIQETKVQDADFPLRAFADSGYNIVFRGEKKYNGVAVLCRHKISEVIYGFDDKPADDSRLLTVRVRDISIVNTYIPQGYSRESEKFDYKLAWFKRLAGFFADHYKPADPVVWTGDFNVAQTAMDVYDPDGLWGHVCYCQEVQEALKEIMKWGFVDVFRMHCDKPGQFTFWDYRLPNGFKRNLGWRLDHIMATGILAAKCQSCTIDTAPRADDKPSDHTAVVADFMLK